jgi:signal transduction histidine kinase
MLHDLLSVNREELIERCRLKSALRVASPSGREQPNGVPPILDLLINTLRSEQSASCRHAPAPARSAASAARQTDSDAPAAQYGRVVSRNGFPAEEIVYGYGDLCQAITDLAVERSAVIQAREFGTLNYCLDQAIADALISYSDRARTHVDVDHAVQNVYERLGFFVHEVRNYLQTITIALAASRAEKASSCAVDAVLDRSMLAMRNLVRRSLADVRAIANQPANRQPLALAEFIAGLKQSASLEAHTRNCNFVVEPVDPSLIVFVDQELLFSALINLLQNAFKFTHPHTEVTLSAFAKGARILIEVADNCGGLPAGNVDGLFRPFTQTGHDRSGIGLGLSICRRSVDANDGVLSVRDMPGTGCVFSIELPRHATQVVG